MHQTPSIIASEFNRTAGIFEPVIARRFVCRLKDAGIAHLATPYDGNTICIFVRRVDLRQAVELQPTVPTVAPIESPKFAISPRLLVTLPLSLTAASLLASLTPVDKLLVTLLGTLFLILSIEAFRFTFQR
jgi:hypothetical protein